MLTPLYVLDEPHNWPKDRDDWPDDEMFYVVASNGLFIGRNTAMGRSLIRMEKGGPSELEEAPEFLVPKYPRVPQKEIEKVVGFFTYMANKHKCEAGCYLVLDTETNKVKAEVPKQVAYVHRHDMEYDPLPDLKPHERIMGTVHSHVFMSAYSSWTDEHDEIGKPGVHIVVGHLDKDPIDWHFIAVADGARFILKFDDAVEGYEKPRNFPKQWVDLVTVDATKSWVGGEIGDYGETYATPDTKLFDGEYFDVDGNVVSGRTGNIVIKSKLAASKGLLRGDPGGAAATKDQLLALAKAYEKAKQQKGKVKGGAGSGVSGSAETVPPGHYVNSEGEIKPFPPYNPPNKEASGNPFGTYPLDDEDCYYKDNRWEAFDWRKETEEHPAYWYNNRWYYHGDEGYNAAVKYGET